MLGGIAVNIFLGFAIYAMVAFVWGKTVLTNENLPSGFEVAEVMKPFGFQDGDKILEVNGESLEDVRDINKYLFLRDIKNDFQQWREMLEYNRLGFEVIFLIGGAN